MVRVSGSPSLLSSSSPFAKIVHRGAVEEEAERCAPLPIPRALLGVSPAPWRPQDEQAFAP